MNILLFGPPGAGKGTQSTYLVNDLHMMHISTGDLFRAHMKDETELGQKAKSFIDKGAYVPDDVTIGMVQDALGQLGQQQNFILDGFPRTVPQAEALGKMLAEMNMTIGKAIFLEVPEELLISRLSGRRLCRECGAVYHVDARPPRDGKSCDECGSEDIYQRSDDQEEAIAERLKTYAEKTLPLKNYYKDQGLLTELEGTGEVSAVYDRLKATIGRGK